MVSAVERAWSFLLLLLLLHLPFKMLATVIRQTEQERRWSRHVYAHLNALLSPKTTSHYYHHPPLQNGNTSAGMHNMHWYSHLVFFAQKQKLSSSHTQHCTFSRLESMSQYFFFVSAEFCENERGFSWFYFITQSYTLLRCLFLLNNGRFFSGSSQEYEKICMCLIQARRRKGEESESA